MTNEIEIKILADGKLQVDTGDFSDSVHADADDFLTLLEEILGGEVIKSPKKNFSALSVVKTKNGTRVSISGLQ